MIALNQSKDKRNIEHQHNIVYQVKCSPENCLDDYIGESARCIIKRVKDQGGTDTKCFYGDL